MPAQFVLDYGIYLLAGLLMLAVLMTYLSHRVGFPALVLFIGLGMLFGSDVLGFIDFDSPFLARFVGVSALILILFEGGLKTDWKAVRPVALPSFVLATLGVVLTAVVLGYAAHLVLGLSLLNGMLLGAIVGSTDAAAVFAIIGPRRIRERVKITLEAESALNDPMAIFLTVLALTILSAPNPSYWQLLVFLVWQAISGIALGFGMGHLAVWIVNRFKLGEGVLYPAFFFSAAMLTYSAGSLLNGSGFLAVYLFGIIIGNSSIPYRQKVGEFHEGIAWLAQVTVFTLLGLLVFPSQLISVAVPGLILAAILTFIARPIAVAICTLGMKYSLRELTFIGWAGLRGAVPIVLATYPFLAGNEHSQLIFNTIFFIVIASTLLQGTTLTPMARLLGLELGPKYTPVHTLELTSLEQPHKVLVEMRITDRCYAFGKTLADLHLPENVHVAAISRGEGVVVPRGSTALEDGDFLFILMAPDQKQAVQALLTDGTPIESAFSEIEAKKGSTSPTEGHAGAS